MQKKYGISVTVQNCIIEIFYCETWFLKTFKKTFNMRKIYKLQK